MKFADAGLAYIRSQGLYATEMGDGWEGADGNKGLALRGLLIEVLVV